MIDQTRLPREETYVTCTDYRRWPKPSADGDPRRAGHRRRGGHGRSRSGMQHAESSAEFETICETLAATRPTAVNLFWAIDRMKRVYSELRGRPIAEIRARLVAEAQQIRLEDIAINECIGRHGAPLIPDGKTVLTHCNAGALATAGYGTALGVIRAAVESGKKIDVFADETRPFLQGARLTVWELQQDHIPATLITDNMAGHFLHSGRIGCVVVGADRIAANGDVANKIGTYSRGGAGQRKQRAVLCRRADLDARPEACLRRPDSDRAARARRSDARSRCRRRAGRHGGGESGVRRHAAPLRHAPSSPSAAWRGRPISESLAKLVQ